MSDFNDDLTAAAKQVEDMQLAPFDWDAPRGFDGAGQSLLGLTRPAASVLRTSALGAAGSPQGAVVKAIRGEEAFDPLIRWTDDVIAANTADAETMGTAAKTINGVLQVGGSVPFLFGSPGAFLTDAAVSPGVDVIEQGGDANTALGVGAVNLGVNALGIKLPASFGTSLGTRLATGAGSNVALGVGADAASREIMEAGGLDGSGYDPTNLTARGMDLLMGLAFGALPNAQRMTKSQRDAVLVANNADHLQHRSMPGVPLVNGADVRHTDALTAVLRQLDKGEPVDVSPTGIRGEDYSGYEAFVVALESGGRADAKAPTSSATGLHQFTDGTWLATVRQAAPAWAEGLGDDALLALRTDPAKSGEMERALRAENAAALEAAGVEADVFNLYAAHHFGAGKGVEFAKADTLTPMADILTPGQIKANPYLKGMTKGEAIANWQGRAERAGVGVSRVTEAPRVEEAGAEFVAARPAMDVESIMAKLDTDTRVDDAFGLRLSRQGEQVTVEDTRPGKLTTPQTVELPEAQKIVREAATEAEQRTATLAKTAPTLLEAERVAVDEPDLTILDGFDGDGAPQFRSLSEALADVETQRVQAANDAAAFPAAVQCFLRRGG